MRRLTSIGASSTSKPATVAEPDVGGRKQVSMRIVVVLPAPLGPRKPTICPFPTSKETWSTAVLRAYLLVSSWTWIIRFVVLGPGRNGVARPSGRGERRRCSLQPFQYNQTLSRDAHVRNSDVSVPVRPQQASCS